MTVRKHAFVAAGPRPEADDEVGLALGCGVRLELQVREGSFTPPRAGDPRSARQNAPSRNAGHAAAAFAVPPTDG